MLCLQEVSDNFPNLKGNDGSDQFAGVCGHSCRAIRRSREWRLDIPDGAGGRRRFGNMILSRLPVLQVLRYTLPWEAAATRNMPRLLLEAVVEAPSGPLRIMTTHLEYSSGELRRAQVEGIREAHRTAHERICTPRENGPGTYVRFPTTSSAVLTGDFNMRPEDPVKRRISDPFGNGAPRLFSMLGRLPKGRQPASAVILPFRTVERSAALL